MILKFHLLEARLRPKKLIIIAVCEYYFFYEQKIKINIFSLIHGKFCYFYGHPQNIHVIMTIFHVIFVYLFVFMFCLFKMTRTKNIFFLKINTLSLWLYANTIKTTLHLLGLFDAILPKFIKGRQAPTIEQRSIETTYYMKTAILKRRCRQTTSINHNSRQTHTNHKVLLHV